MKKYNVLMAVLASVVIITGCNAEQQQQENEIEENQELSTEESEIETEGNDFDIDESVSLAEQFIEQLSQGKYDEAIERFDDTMSAQISVAELGELWETIESQVGAFIDYDFESTQEVDGYLVVLLNGLFEEADVMFTISFDEQNQIAGFFIQ
ncbi:DUF3887 domain-containing protein [Halalkalibacter okhensis]|uniref:DUF3887 domain-containing protein n=1 Tax=Halalkalibacter okhensis TaxID=333138 RepID=A0A0B0INP0_9BACI|nr:DUF3887 domain-containing protein [Halalkalibacter okhensis]KHF41699.1 hypothetical protein LQ50_03080 [Halalkalibacter okhensis]